MLDVPAAELCCFVFFKYVNNFSVMCPKGDKTCKTFREKNKCTSVHIFDQIRTLFKDRV